MRPLVLVFDNAATEEEFRAEFDPKAARAARAAILAGSPGYALMAFIVDDTAARSLAVTMLALMVAWAAVSWTRFYAHRCQAVNIAVLAVLTALSLALFLALPAGSALIVAIPYVTLTFMWLFLLLRLRVAYSMPFGLAYVIALPFVGAVLWDRYGNGDAPEGLRSVLAGPGGGAAVVLAYSAFLLVLCAFVARRLERGERRDFLLQRELDAALERSEWLLTNVLPVPIAERLKAFENPIADDCAAVSVIFADIVGFTTMSAPMRPSDVLALLNEVFTRFDQLADMHGLEKIKTIGDAYMAVAGAPERVRNHAHVAVAMGLDMLAAIGDLTAPDGSPLAIRVGIGSGPAVSGVIGTRKFAYDLWGDTVNTASRMESHGVPGAVQVDDVTRQLAGDSFEFDDRGMLTIKGKGPMRAWLVTARSAEPRRRAPLSRSGRSEPGRE
jgi:class 3 adenylate cyclase